MDASKDRGSIPEQFERIKAAVDIWGTSGIANYWGQPRGVGIDAYAPRWRRVFSLAGIRGVSSETLIGLWLTE